MSGAANIERRDSGPAHLDRTSDEWFEPELSDDLVDAADDLFGMAEPTALPASATHQRVVAAIVQEKAARAYEVAREGTEHCLQERALSNLSIVMQEVAAELAEASRRYAGAVAGDSDPLDEAIERAGGKFTV